MVRLAQNRTSFMRTLAISLVVSCLVVGSIALFPAPAYAQEGAVASGHKASEEVRFYYPGPWGDWERKRPAEVGMDADKLEDAIRYAVAHESGEPKELSKTLAIRLAGEPLNEVIGPVKDRGPISGIVLRHGYIVSEWGDTRRVDMTFSVTKSYLSTVAGLAVDQGLIRNVHDSAKDYVQDGSFDSPHNAKITWHQLLNQTSEWEGTLWGKPDWADRWRGKMRKLHEPGSHWQYNDVRVNCLALALLHLWRKPLPLVLKEHIMDPIGASPTWRWHGYRNSWVTIDGIKMQSVSGGGHWGGGMWISTRDHARFGYLFLRRGKWQGRQLISEAWIDRAFTPTPQRPTYGYMNWFPNTDRQLYPSAPESTIVARGAGANLIWLNPDHDLLAVVRWIDAAHMDGFITRVLASVKGSGSQESRAK